MRCEPTLLEDFWDLVVWAEADGAAIPRDRWVAELDMRRQVDSFAGLM